MERQSETARSEFGALLVLSATALSDGSRLLPDTAICKVQSCQAAEQDI